VNVFATGDQLSADQLRQVAEAAARDAGDLDPSLLGDFISAAERAAGGGRRLGRAELARYRLLGGEAARAGVALRAVVDLYLSAAWRLWPVLPAVAHAGADRGRVVQAGEALLRANADAVAAVTEGFQLTRRSLVRREEAERREFVDDLLLGRSDARGLLHRAAGYGLDLSGPHAVAVVRAEGAFHEGTAVLGNLERAILGSKGDAHVLVTSKSDLLVVVFAAPDRAAIGFVAEQLTAVLGAPAASPGGVQLRRPSGVGDWMLGLSRPRPGAVGVRVSLDEARGVLELADRLGLPGPVVDAADQLVYQVLLRDSAAMNDLVSALLTPLLSARGGAEPLLATLRAYFDAGGNAARAARSLHLSVRAFTYRLERVKTLTGHDPGDPDQRFALQAAVLGALLLDWPATSPV
jgi:DNA-binding PucR family transcriptional regulator